MILRILALIILPVLSYYLMRSISTRYALTSRQNKVLFVVILTVLLLSGAVILGRLPIHFILAPIGVALTYMLRMLPTILRLMPLWQMLKSRTSFGASRPPGQTSTIRTEFLSMELDHDTGNMDGMVLKGNYSGHKLSTLSQSDLIVILGECSHDSDSSQVLQAYLDRNHPAWRDQSVGSGNVGHNGDESIMTRTLALEILGLPETAGKSEIVKAHRHLMQKMHPDRGGSDYLAKKINTAKDYLLKNL